MSKLLKVLLPITLSAASALCFANSCDHSELQILNNSAAELKIESIHETSNGPLGNIIAGMTIAPNAKVVAETNADWGDNTSGVIYLRTSDARITLEYEFNAAYWGLGECKAKLTPTVDLNDDAEHGLRTRQSMFDGRPAFVSFEIEDD